MRIRKAFEADLDAMERLYDEVNEHLEAHVNYPGWKKGAYPTRETAEKALEGDCLYVACESSEGEEKILGTIVLRQEPYLEADWGVKLSEEEVFILHTFAVHPQALHKGIGRELLAFALKRAGELGGKAVRLDVNENNVPAIRLYEEFGFEYIDAREMEYSEEGTLFCLYQYQLAGGENSAVYKQSRAVFFFFYIL